MAHAQRVLTVATSGRGFHDVTEPIGRWVKAQSFAMGLVTVFVRHTSASLLIQENADPNVLADLAAFFARIIPEDPDAYRHSQEGPDDMPAHIRTAITQTHLSIPIVGGALGLGTWQAIYLVEHRRAGHRREIVLHASGEGSIKRARRP